MSEEKQDAGKPAVDMETIVKSVLEKLTPEIGNVVNKAVTSQLERESKRAAKERAEAEAKQQGQPLANGQPTTEQAKEKDDPRVVKLLAQVEQLTQKYQQSEERAAQITRDNAVNAMRAAAADSLSKKGIVGTRAKAAISMLELEGRLGLTEQGTGAVFITRKNSFGQADKVAYDIGEGLDEWCKSEEAKDFLPAPTPIAKPASRSPFAPQAPLASPKARDSSLNAGIAASIAALEQATRNNR